ncbi:hypothetical protein PN36_26200 [Candidatus Thiomargarita nelsonii]|uniref:Uncharacterized protein n=1 Tax=Candidatus Thiomargarita nelsonii TaxID=1003181 RepID=A0A4E0RF00_9GAMM|nr:hypothetical protein PN36_26200 [Candidatus Thiomargarita nelsonii]
MTVKWTPEIEQRFTELRLCKLSGSLTEDEQRELAEIQATVEIVESDTTAFALKRLETEQIALQDILEKRQTENKEFLQLLNQQALLIADTKQMLSVYRCAA